MAFTASTVATSASNVAFVTSNVAFVTSNVAFVTSNVAFVTSNVATSASAVAAAASNVAYPTSNVTYATSAVATATSNYAFRALASSCNATLGAASVTSLAASGAVSAGSLSTSGALAAGYAEIGGSGLGIIDLKNNAAADFHGRLMVDGQSNLSIFTRAGPGALHLGASNVGGILAISPPGNVGVWTTTPAERLDVVGSARCSTGFKVNAWNGYLLDDLFANSNDRYGLHMSGAVHRMYTSCNSGPWRGQLALSHCYGDGLFLDRLSVNSNGFVGIGTATPTSLLHVNGGAEFEGLVAFNGALEVGSAGGGMIDLKNNAASDYNARLILDGQSNLSIFTRWGPGSLNLGTSNVTRLSISSTGQITMGDLTVSDIVPGPMLRGNAEVLAVRSRLLVAGPSNGGCIDLHPGLSAAYTGGAMWVDQDDYAARLMVDAASNLLLMTMAGAGGSISIGPSNLLNSSLTVSSAGNVGVGGTPGTNKLQVAGQTLSTTMCANGYSGSTMCNAQGAYVMWNLDNGGGRTCFWNNRGGSTTGGFDFINATSAGAVSSFLRVTDGPTLETSSSVLTLKNSQLDISAASGFAAMEMYGPVGAFIDMRATATSDYGVRIMATTTNALSMTCKGTFNAYTGAGFCNLIMDANGQVGIGTASPAFRLDVAGVVNSTGGFRTPSMQGYILDDYYGGGGDTGDRFGLHVASPGIIRLFTASGFNKGTLALSHCTSNATFIDRLSIGSAGAVTISTALTVNSTIYATGTITQGSDARIKKDVVPVDDGAALGVLRQLEPSVYRYVDSEARGDGQIYGFIAQQVEAVLPYAVSRRTEVVPNVYSMATVSASNAAILTLDRGCTSNLDFAAAAMGSNSALELSIYASGSDRDAERTCFVDAVLDDFTIRLAEPLPPGVVDVGGNGDGRVFVLGQRVANFCALDKAAIFSVGIAALQEVDRQQQSNVARIAALESNLEAALQRLDAAGL